MSTILTLEGKPRSEIGGLTETGNLPKSGRDNLLPGSRIRHVRNGPAPTKTWPPRACRDSRSVCTSNFWHPASSSMENVLQNAIRLSVDEHGPVYTAVFAGIYTLTKTSVTLLYDQRWRNSTVTICFHKTKSMHTCCLSCIHHGQYTPRRRSQGAILGL